MNKVYTLFFILFSITIAIFGCNSSETKVNAGEISSKYIITKINKTENIEYVDKTITGVLDFSTISNKYTRNPAIEVAEINSAITFVNCHFTDSIIGFRVADAYADITKFTKSVTFIKCTFDKAVLFRQNEFNDIVEFSNCTFNDETRFEGVSFNNNNVYFHETTFEKRTKFTNATFSGNVTFMNAVFNSNFDFNNVHVKQNANFSACNFKMQANFGNTGIDGFLRLNYSIFDKKAYFQNCFFFGAIEAVKIVSKENFIFSRNTCYSYVNFENSNFSNNVEFSNNYFFKGKTTFENMTKSDSTIVNQENNHIFTDEIIHFDFKILENK